VNSDARISKPARRGRPISATLFYRALEFASAADAYVWVHDVQRDGYMVMFLLGRALELALKSALLANGVSARELRSKKFGHDIQAMVHAADKLGLMMIDPEVPDTKWGMSALSAAYASKELEYQELGTASGPSPPLLRRIVHFAIHRAALYALEPDVRERLLRNDSKRTALTLSALDRYRTIQPDSVEA
jgi:hypothetical protein